MSTIQFPSDEAKQAYWDLHKPPGAPTEIQDKYLDYLEAKLPGETWETFVTRWNSVRQNYERAADVTMAVYAPDKFILGTGSDGFRTGMDELLARVAPLWRAEQAVGADTWLRWCQLASIFHFVPTTTDERVAEFVWSKVRCFVAGAGYHNHAALADELTSLYPGCPFVVQETEEEWQAALLKAHAACGWPATLGYLNYSKLTKLLGAGDEAPELWLRMTALLHVLKHTRVSDTQGVIVHFAGVSTILPDEQTNAIGTWAGGKSALLAALGARPPGNRQKVPYASQAVSAAIAHLEVNHLLRKETLGSLPANLLAGPWTMAVPDHEAMDGFYQTGLRMSGLWSARNGKVGKDHLGQLEVLSYDWNCKNPAAQSEARKLFASGLPATYDCAWPSEAFLDAFPNFDLSWQPGELGAEALKTLLDVPIAASLIRMERPEFRAEYPAVVFMPSNPSPTDSTNQGKSQAALVYARAVNPAISKLVSINDSSSAPDIRTVAGEIRATGGIAVDEFRPPKNACHIFSHDNLQALCTGSGVASGRVYENEGTVAFRSSPVFSAKVYEVPPDIQNRSLAGWLGPLTDAMRKRSEVLDQMRNGALSLRMRLGMHAILETSGLAAAYAAAGRQSSSKGLRFDAHRTLAGCMLAQKAKVTMDEAYAALDKACEAMQNRMRSHIQTAVDTGLVAAMEFGTALKLRLSYLFDDMTPDEFTKFRQTVNVAAAGRPGGVANGVSGKDMLHAWSTVQNIEGKPYQEYLQILTGTKRHVSNRAVVMALNASIHELVPVEGAQWFLPGTLGTLHGWVMVRAKDDLVTFKCLHPGAPKS